MTNLYAFHYHETILRLAHELGIIICENRILWEQKDRVGQKGKREQRDEKIGKGIHIFNCV